LAAAFAVQAAIAVDRAACQLAVTNLHIAIDTNRNIGAAVGILMAQQGISYEAAFHLLRSRSQNDNRKLRDVAAEILTSHDQPAGRKSVVLRKAPPPPPGAAAQAAREA
jgi:AmiR/NasT family two-component response regulator